MPKTNGGYNFRTNEWAEAKGTFFVVKRIFEESFCESLKASKELFIEDYGTWPLGRSWVISLKVRKSSLEIIGEKETLL